MAGDLDGTHPARVRLSRAGTPGVRPVADGRMHIELMNHAGDVVACGDFPLEWLASPRRYIEQPLRFRQHCQHDRRPEHRTEPAALGATLNAPPRRTPGGP